MYNVNISYLIQQITKNFSIIFLSKLAALLGIQFNMGISAVILKIFQ
jgi:hypothetical protein